jgi:cation diffusion facilitator family transporter
MDHAKAGYAEGIVSVVVNCCLFALKLWAGMVIGSLALVTDAWHTMSDSISSIMVIVGIKLSTRKPDKEHPFGHGRWEHLIALFIAFMLSIIAYDFLKEAIIHFYNKQTVQYGTFALVVTAVSIVTKEALAQYAFYIGRKTDNASITADGWHHRTDSFSSIVVLTGILIAKYFWWIDSVLSAIIALMLFYATYKIVKESITKILGEQPSPELICGITAIAQTIYHEDLQLHHFHIHNYVFHKELTFHIKLNKNISIEAGHLIATELEDKIKEQYGIIATIHIEPLDFYHKMD